MRERERERERERREKREEREREREREEKERELPVIFLSLNSAHRKIFSNLDAICVELIAGDDLNSSSACLTCSIVTRYTLSFPPSGVDPFCSSCLYISSSARSAARLSLRV